MPPPENRKRRTKRVKILDTSSWSDEEKAAHERKAKLDTPIAEMALPVRVVNALEDNNVLLAADLMTQSYESLMKMKNFGEKTLTEVQAALQELGLEPPVWQRPPKEKKLPKLKGGGKSMIKFW